MGTDIKIPHPDIPTDRLQRWQQTVNLMAEVVSVPAGLIMRVHPDEIEVLISSDSVGNPYQSGASECLMKKLYCETVIDTQLPLSVPNALKDPMWDHNPDIKLNMIAYYGLPLSWPDGTPFGTICVLDNKENDLSEQYKQLVGQFAALVNADLQILSQMSALDTERHSLEQRVEEKTRELRREVAERTVAENYAVQANKSKTQFLAIVSHELRTPLNAIIGFATMIKSEVFGHIDEKKYIDYAKDIHFAGNHLLSLINDILDVSSIEADALTLHEESVDLVEIIDQCEVMLSARAKEEGLSLRRALPNALPHLFGDKLRISQMYLNVLSNAVKFTPEGGIITTSARLRKNGALVLSVKDTGIGIAEGDISKVQEPFAQVEDIYAREKEGTGLGLVLVGSLAHLHGGKMNIRSQLGEGTEVLISFPAARVQQDRHINEAD